MVVQHVFECVTCGERDLLQKYPEAGIIRCLRCKKLKVNTEDIFVDDLEKQQFLEKARQTYAQCYDEILDLITRYMEIPIPTAKLVALWTIGTYFHNSFPTYPFLYFTAMKGSGKTRLLKIISHLAKGSEGEVHTGITESVLFRMPKNATLVLDECESISSKEKGVLREYMNACYKAGGVVQRMKKTNGKEGEKFEVDKFEPYKPIAMANIYGMDEVLGDRALTVILEKSNNPAKTKLIEDFTSNPMFKSIKSSLNRFQCSLCSVVTCLEHIKEWNNYILTKNSTTTHTTYTTITTLTTLQLNLLEMFNKIDSLEIEGRNLELMFPLLIISSVLSRDLFDEICEIARETAKQKKEEDFVESRDISLIDFVCKNRYGLEYISVTQLTREFREYLGNLDDEDRWLNSRWLGRALKRLGLVLSKQRKNVGMEVIINQHKAKEKLLMFKVDNQQIKGGN